jgi:uncharacterized repeat protein (TIGR03803 family)
MSARCKPVRCASLRFCDLIKLPLKFAIAVLFIAPASPVGAQAIQTIYTFTNGSSANSLTFGNDGNFYGTTGSGGTYGVGTVFKVTTNGTLTTLASFNSTNGASPNGMTLGNDGSFYGTTGGGGIYGIGTVFKMTTNGSLISLYSFTNGNDGSLPSVLTLGDDGNFYGTTAGGAEGGAVFQVTTNGTLTALYSFTNGASLNALTLGSDGDFYGTTGSGGTYGAGTVFKVTTNGTLTTLASFNVTNPNYYPNGPEPNGLTLGNDGNFYGTTAEQDAGGYGTVFQVGTNGTLTTLACFSYTNGAYPLSTLALGKDGNFYGTTTSGGSAGDGTIFQVTTNGTLTTLVNCGNQNGGIPSSSLVLCIDGNFYGATARANGSGYGTVFRLLLTSVSPIIGSQPQSQTVRVGSNQNFDIEALGAPPLVFRWYFNGVPLGPPAPGTIFSSATFSSWALTNVGTNQSGIYTVQVSNASGNVTSSNAVLTVLSDPTLALQIVTVIENGGRTEHVPSLTVNAGFNNDFVVQYSTNLAGTNWITLFSVTNSSASPYWVMDGPIDGQAARFYRALFTQ